ncbi:Uncharacterised protein [Chlamydia trachomatis]|nr:Uncharacterised protein [Chlamydia trachomatis]
MLGVVEFEQGNWSRGVKACGNAPLAQRMAKPVGVRQHIELSGTTDELIAAGHYLRGITFWRAVQRKSISLMVKACPIIQGIACHTPEPAPYSV